MAKAISSTDGHCKDLLERFSAYLDGELDQGCCQELELHLADCVECVDTVDGMRRMLAICRQEREAATGATPSPEFRRRLLDALFTSDKD